VFYGCQRYKKVLRVLLSALFFNKGSALNRGDYQMLSVLSYLLLFRLDEMGWARLRPLVESQPLNRVHVLLDFVLDDETTGRWLVEDWSAVLDRAFVSEQMLGGLKRAEGSIRDWMAGTHASAFGGGDEGAAAKAQAQAADGADAKGGGAATGRRTAHKRGTTRARSPRITKPRPRVLPEPMRVEQGVKARPVPASLDATTLRDVQSRDEQRRQETFRRTKAKHRRAAAPFLHETRDTTTAARARVEAELEAELRFDGVPARPPPALPLEGADVRLTAAAVLREDFLLRQRQEKEASTVRQFEAELRDGAEFFQWQARMRATDEEARLLAVRQRKVDMEASAEAAKTAVSKGLRERKRVADAMRRRRALGEELTAEERRAEEEAGRRLAKEVRDVRETKPREAERALAEERAEAARAAREASREAEEAVRARREAEAAVVADRIRRLRAEETEPAARGSVVFDPTTTAGHGFLGELSLQEAHERLAMDKAREEEEVERRRLAIMTRRRREQLDLEERMASIRRVRGSAAAVARSSKERRLRATGEARAEEDARRTEGALALEEKLRLKREARDAERRALEEESRRIAKRAVFLGAAQSATEERRHEQLRLNRETAAKRAAAGAVDAEKAESRSRALAAGERSRSRRASRRERSSVRARATEALRVGAMEADAVAAGERSSKREAFFSATAREERLALARAGDNVFATTIKEREADKARRRWGGEDREEQRSRVLAVRLARATAEQAERTGLAETVERRGPARAALTRKMRATMNESARVTQRLASGLSAAGTSAAAPRDPPAGRRQAEAWRREESDASAPWSAAEAAGSDAETKRGGGEGPGAARPTGAMAERRGVLMATVGDAAGWEALQR